MASQFKSMVEKDSYTFTQGTILTCAGTVLAQAGAQLGVKGFYSP